MRKTVEVSRFSLEGDWTICGVAEQFPRLSQQLSLLSGSLPPQKRRRSTTSTAPEIDLGGISALDACGCQLLAHFSHALHQSGISPHYINLPEAFRSTIHLLGFSREFIPSF